MKSKVYFIFFAFHFLTFELGKAQVNLVLNPSFEEYTGQCTSATLGNNCAGSVITGWYNPTDFPSYWDNSCNNFTSPDFGVPSNYCGYQYAHSGQAYSEIYADTEGGRLYVSGRFSKPLTYNKKYCVNFYVSLSDSISWYAISALGAFISDTAPCVHNYIGILTGNPQIENSLSSPLLNKIEWVPVSGEYLANGGEQYITIGDFYSNAMSNFTFTGGGIQFDTNKVVPEAVYYLDDISVREIHFANALNGKKDTNVCNGGSLLIGADSAVAGVSYQWLPTTGLQSPNSVQTIATPTVTTTYTLIVKNDSMSAWNAVGGCHCPDSISRDSVTIRVIPFYPSVCCDTTITLWQTVSLEAFGGNHYLWSPSQTGECDTCLNLLVSPSQTTTYTVAVRSDSGCKENLTVTVDVTCGVAWVPNIFTPNGDNINDVLYVQGNCIATMDFLIFDRWGNKVFEGQNVSTGWDGKYKGQPASSGVYYYILNAKFQDEKSILQKGNLQLIR